MPKKKAPSTLTGEAAKIWEKVYQDAWDSWDAKKTKSSQEEYAAKIAWTAVENAGYRKNKKTGKWVKSKSLAFRRSFRLRITRSKMDEDGVVHWHAQAANDEIDDGDDEGLDPSLFTDLATNFQLVTKAYSEGIEPPEFGHGVALLPILDLAHYSALISDGDRDKARLGTVTKLYRDGRYLHAAGTFDTTERGKLAAKSVLEDEEGVLRTSVGFYPDWDNFEVRAGILIFKGSGGTKPKAYLDHIAITSVPRIKSTTIEVGQEEQLMSDVTTMEEDAKRILGEDGEEIVSELEELAGAMKTESMVLLSEDETEKIEETEETVVEDEQTEPEVKKEELVTGADSEPAEGMEVDSEAMVTECGECVEVVRELPFGGATSFDGAKEWMEAVEEKYRIYDGWAVFQAVTNNILADNEIEDKTEAMDEAMKQFQAFLKSGDKLFSEVEVEVEEAQETDVIEESEAVPVEETPVVVVEPVLDAPTCPAPSLGGTPPEATPFSTVEDMQASAATTPNAARAATSFADAVAKLEQLDVPAQSKQQAARELVAVADTELQKAFAPVDGSVGAEEMAVVMEQAMAPILAELTEIRALVYQSGIVPEVMPTAPKVPGRKSRAPVPNITPSRRLTQAKTFSEVVERLVEKSQQVQ